LSVILLGQEVYGRQFKSLRGSKFSFCLISHLFCTLLAAILRLVRNESHIQKTTDGQLHNDRHTFFNFAHKAANRRKWMTLCASECYVAMMLFLTSDSV
jgi:hypothetical protein